MRNFSSTAAIMVALQSDHLKCLSETLRTLDSNDKTMLAELSSFVKSEQAYHTAISSSQDPYIPCIGK